MDLNIIIALLFALFAGGNSIKCYDCVTLTSSCVSKETTCPSAAYTCVSATAVATIGDISATSRVKGCDLPQNCISGSYNLGVIRTALSVQCCNTDLCNSQFAPDSSSNSTNGKQCYYCDGKSCLNQLNCLGTEDSCVSAKSSDTSLPSTVKGCISKSMCNSLSQQGYTGISCCQGNLCNSAKSITQSLLFLSWTFISYLIFH